MFYLFGTGRILHFTNPKRYSEKIQLLKVKVNTAEKLGQYVDKLQVRDIVAKLIGVDYLNDLRKVVDAPDYLDFEQLNYPCVVKTTHDSGTVFVLQDAPKQLKREAIKLKLARSLNHNYFWKGRETPYRYAQPKIIVENYLKDGGWDTPVDYKFYCFEGTVRLLQTTIKKNDIQYVNYYNSRMDFMELKSGQYGNLPNFVLPSAVDEMKSLAEKLSDGFCHVRIDFYFVDNKPIFGEYTFHSDGGLLSFSDPNFDLELGSYIKCV